MGSGRDGRGDHEAGRPAPDRQDPVAPDPAADPPVGVGGRELAHRAYHVIRAEIRDGALRPGEHLAESRLARRLGTSSMPVREALLMLERDGFVETEPYRGAFVARLGPQDVAELFELRILLEPRAAAHAARRLGAGARPNLEAADARAADALAAGDVPSARSALDELHRLVAAAAPNRRLTKAVRNLSDQMARITEPLAAIPGRLAQNRAEHALIAEAITAGDAAGAEAAMAAHLRSLEAAYRQLAQAPEAGPRPRPVP